MSTNVLVEGLEFSLVIQMLSATTPWEASLVLADLDSVEMAPLVIVRDITREYCKL